MNKSKTNFMNNDYQNIIMYPDNHFNFLHTEC